MKAPTSEDASQLINSAAKVLAQANETVLCHTSAISTLSQELSRTHSDNRALLQQYQERARLDSETITRLEREIDNQRASFESQLAAEMARNAEWEAKTAQHAITNETIKSALGTFAGVALTVLPQVLPKPEAEKTIKEAIAALENLPPEVKALLPAELTKFFA